MEIPVYLFTGFLESGKSTFIKETMEEGNFEDGEKTLLLLCEEGIEEFEDEFLNQYNMSVEIVKDGGLTTEFLEECQRKHKPARVFIEYNGTWKTEDLFELKPPKKWTIVQTINLVNAETFEVYIANMRSLLMEQFTTADMVIFNRCTEETKKASYRRSIKAVNRKAQIYFEGDFEPGDEEEELPFDLNADIIDIDDDDYGIWYIDAMDNPERYEGKVLRFTARVYKGKDLSANSFVPGRHAMTCCADDIAFIGFVCKSKQANQLTHRQWVKVTAELKTEYRHEYKGKGPVLYGRDVEATKEPEEELVYFN